MSWNLQIAPELADRWEALLGKAPRLRPVVATMIARRRSDLQQRLAAVEIEHALCEELSRWLRDFEKLPHFALAAIATTLHEERVAEPPPLDVEELLPDFEQRSPERNAGELQTLLGDPAFALAFHCVESRVRPALAATELAVTERAWFGLLHASARNEPTLTARVAVALILRVRGEAPCAAALRLFLARPADLRGDLQRLCDALPPGWRLKPGDLPQFVDVAVRARRAFDEAAELCRRIMASLKSRPGGLASLEPSPASPATPEELSALARSAWIHKEITGFRKLLGVL